MKTTTGSFFLAAVASLVTTAAHAEDFKLGGDIRYRHENVGSEGSAVSSYDKDRLRFRLGAKAQVDEEVGVEARLSTAPGRVSTNQDLGTSANANANYSITLDRAAFNWMLMSGLNLKGGRIANPLYAAADADMVFDTDVNFDALALTYSTKMGSSEIFVNLMDSILDKNTSAYKSDVHQYTAQVGGKIAMDDQTLGVAVAMHDFQNLQSHTILGSSATNTTYASAGTRYTYGYKPMVVDVAFTTPVAGKPLVASVEYVRNTNSDVTDDKDGYMVGVKYGSLKEKGDYALSYDYRVIKKDATVSVFTDGDSFGGGTNGNSHRLVASYQESKNMTANLCYFMGKSGLASGDTEVARNKVAAEVVVKF